MAELNVTPALNPFPLKENEGGALNLTRFAGIGAAIVVLLTTVNDSWTAIFGEHAPTWARPVVFVAVIGAWAFIAAADMLARGYAAGHRDKFVALASIIPARDDRGDDTNCEVVGIRVAEDDSDLLEYLVLKDGKTPEWVPGANIKFRDPAASGRSSGET
jgi:hypothetical protein